MKFVIEVESREDATTLRNLASDIAEAVGFAYPVTDSTDTWYVRLLDDQDRVVDMWGG